MLYELWILYLDKKSIFSIYYGGEIGIGIERLVETLYQEWEGIGGGYTISTQAQQVGKL